MTPELKKKWVDGLRSGKYKQTSKVFRSEDGCHCVMGVLLEEMNIPKERTGYAYRGLSYTFGMPYSFYHEIGLNIETMHVILMMNDVEQRPFDAIADYIERTV